MTHFIFKLPVFTIVRRAPPALGSVLMIANDEDLCLHLFTDADLCQRYLKGMGLEPTHLGIRLSTRRQLRQFLQHAPGQVGKVVFDASSEDGVCQRGLVIGVDQVLMALDEPDYSIASCRWEIN
jgi:hypothetical protein